jgi:flagellar hook assembly protein FlgD
MFRNYPNPFNSSTNITFTILKKSQIIIDVYNLYGKIVKNLINKHFYAGEYTINWDGKNELGNEVASGIYLLKLKVGDYEQTKQIIFIPVSRQE